MEEEENDDNDEDENDIVYNNNNGENQIKSNLEKEENQIMNYENYNAKSNTTDQMEQEDENNINLDENRIYQSKNFQSQQLYHQQQVMQLKKINSNCYQDTQLNSNNFNKNNANFNLNNNSNTFNALKNYSTNFTNNNNNPNISLSQPYSCTNNNNSNNNFNSNFLSNNNVSLMSQINNFFSQQQIEVQSHISDIKDKFRINDLDKVYNKENQYKYDLDQQGPEYQYTKDIFDYLKTIEDGFKPNENYMQQMQNDINEQMRAILIDWLVDVHLKFKLVPETLYMTVNLIDRYLETNQTNRSKLQLVGVTSLFIASKYEEIYPPDLKDFVYVCDNAYTKDQILAMEGKILLENNFLLTYTSPYRFLHRYSQLMSCCESTTYLAQYFLELSLIEFKMLKYGSSNLAGSALMLANKIIQNNKMVEGEITQPTCTWNSDLQKQSQFSENNLKPAAKDLLILMTNIDRSSLQAVKRKFTSSKFSRVATIKIAQK
ncbi:Cyclin-like protein [Pseudocohnilembus persalinus]|uniref:Cyclin-like protein n=1 Tax=Pseudocohnilembus persalinus TaxID=266149 RepID=A0A0V0QRT6_PSEPJ|nr:Cyclin-like protein [Pseudocohnilembus persalinus]|eukprot:KRX04995.1 Cyclin-like protein [Pseudocohnilembus persalinus]